MSVQATIRVEVTGLHRSGTASKTGKPYCMYEGFVHLPTCQYPQKASFYAETAQQIPQVGMYECDIVADVRDGRLIFDVDPRQGRRMSQQPKAAAVSAAS